MASSLVARGAAALPSVRVAALPGQGGAVVSVRRDGTGRGGVLAVRRDGTRGRGGVLAVRRDGTGRGGGVLADLSQVPFPLPTWVVKATGAQSDEPTDEDSAEFELVLQLKEERDRNLTEWRHFTVSFAVPHPDEDFLPEDCQDTLTRYADSSFELWAVVANRLRPPTESDVYQGLKLCGETIVRAAVSCDKGCATWKSVSDVVEALDLLRRLASSTLEAPLPQDWRLGWEASFPMSYNDAEMGLIFTLQRTFVLVERDLKSMLEDAN